MGEKMLPGKTSPWTYATFEGAQDNEPEDRFILRKII